VLRVIAINISLFGPELSLSLREILAVWVLFGRACWIGYAFESSGRVDRDPLHQVKPDGP
jgi:hypothetical protein